MKTTQRDYALLFINGERTEVRGEQCAFMLADFLRYKKGLTGTKIVCAEGDCGACSVLRWFPYSEEKSYFVPFNSCISTVAQLDGSNLVTVEYLGKAGLDPVQKAMLECHASQCGYCTPGFVMALKGLVEKKKTKKENTLTEKEAKNSLTGNLCRCTGYRQILDAALSIRLEDSVSLFTQPTLVKNHKVLQKEIKTPLKIETPEYSFFAPTTLKAATQYLAKNADTQLLGAGTDLGVAVNKGKIKFQKVLSLHLIPELYEIEKVKNKKEPSYLRVGARVTLESVRRATEKTHPEFSNYLDIFASPQIKNVATLVGNTANASPIGDTLPFLIAMNARVLVASARTNRVIALKDFFLKYRTTALKKGEIITAIEFEMGSPKEALYLLKTSQRKDLDISAVNGAIRITPTQARVALGGVASIPLRLEKVEKYLASGKREVSDALKLLQEEIKPLSDLRGSQALRRLVAENFIRTSLEDFAVKVPR